MLGTYAHLFARANFVPHVNRRRRILADANRRQARANAVLFFHLLDLRLNFFLDPGGERSSLERTCTWSDVLSNHGCVLCAFCGINSIHRLEMLFARLILLCILWSAAVVPAAAQASDYVLGRNAERTGDMANATARYQAVASSNSKLREYALWHLAKLARSTGDLTLERERLRQLTAAAPSNLLAEAATLRLTESFFESGDFQGAANSAKPLLLSKNLKIARKGATLLGLAHLRAGKTAEARDVLRDW